MKGIPMNRSGGLMTSKPVLTSEALVLIEPPRAGGYSTTAMDAVIVPSPRVSLSRARDFVTLTKPEITLLVVLATGLGSMMASTGLDQVLFLHVLCGTALLASGSATLNQYLERAHDACCMRRCCIFRCSTRSWCWIRPSHPLVERRTAAIRGVSAAERERGNTY